MNILDNIHTFFIHSYDNGFRIKNIEYKNNDDNHVEDDDNLHIDQEMIMLKKEINSKRRRFADARGQDSQTHLR